MTPDVYELIRRFRLGQPSREIARELGITRKTVARYRALAKAEQFLEGPMPAIAELHRRLAGRAPAASLLRPEFRATPWRPIIEKLRERGVEARAIYDRLRHDHGYTGSYSSVYRFLKHLEGGSSPQAFLRVETPAGEEAQVDFGYAGKMIDPTDGEERKAWVFVMTLSFSRHQYATFVFDQKISTWLRCHREAFEAFGGVPWRIVIDNLRSAISKAVFHDPLVQRSYREFAEHYGFLIAPCRVATPRHKGKVESGVRYVKRNFLAGRDVIDLTVSNRELARWTREIAGRRIHGTTHRPPLERFETIEKGALQPLPETSYDMGVWKAATLHPDCHLVLDYAFYSAPHRLIGEKLWLRSNGREVVVFHEYERIATHEWGPPGTRRTIADHYPPEKAMWLMATPTYCLQRATEIGPNTLELVLRLFQDRPLDPLRKVQAILRLTERHGQERLELASRRALHFDDLRYATIKRILVRGLENEPLPERPDPSPAQSFVFARPGSEIFA
jgi:transposase